MHWRLRIQRLAVLASFLSTLVVSTTAWSQTSDKPLPSWIWSAQTSDNQEIVLRKRFMLDGDVKQAEVVASVDNQCEVFINNRRVLRSNEWSQLTTGDALRGLRPGANVISLTAKNESGVAGALIQLKLTMSNGSQIEIVSDGSWKVSSDASGQWKTAAFDDASWSSVKVLGKLGDAGLAWSGSLTADALQSVSSSADGEYVPIIADNAQVPEGFQIERIYQVPRAMGSWVSIALDPKGRLIACDQGGAGLFMITPGQMATGDKAATPTRVEKLPVNLSSAHGLLWAFDSLYAMVNGTSEPGLHRLRDTNGDGLVDTDEYCMSVPGSGEHGPHAIVLSPDKKSLYVAAGNHTPLPNAIAGSRMPRNWNEDHLLPRRWDANGHAAGILAPGGWVCEVDPAGKQWNVVSMGYRNQYDIAFNEDGELFAYDADMEWDFGSPWYRPTRVCHATSGSEFGWRSGTGKWPTYYEDSLPPAVEIGPGSPTGIVFGTGTKFPARYQKALFLLDWTYSTIYSIDFKPSGSSYVGTKSDFVTGSPLPVTDAVVGNDGALYFAAGGRGTQSGVYRVTYVGKESTARVSGHDAEGEELRKLRHRLENAHGNTSGDLKFIMQHLGHEDRFVRYAARVALENQPVDKWRGELAKLSEPKAVISGAIALAHQGKPEDQAAILARLNALPFESLSESDQLSCLRAYELAFTRLGQPSESAKKELAGKLDKLYPAKSYPLNAELVQLLVYLESPSVVEKTLKLMDSLGSEPIPDWGYLVARNANYGGTVGKMLSDMPPVRGIHFAFTLRNVKSGWTLPQRKKYFEFFIAAAKHPGGNSFGKFLSQFRDDAVQTCNPAEKIVLDPLINTSLLGEPIQSTPPVGPGRKWSTADVLEVVGSNLKGRNFKSGQNLYHATSCSKCHRMAGEGGSIGPDLSTAAKKFSMTDLVDAITEPSKAISDQYGSQQVVTVDGQVLVGRAVEIQDDVYVYTIDVQAKPIILKKNEVEKITPSKLSQMPVGLIDSLNPEELKDLMAFLMASGDQRHAIYRNR